MSEPRILHCAACDTYWSDSLGPCCESCGKEGKPFKQKAGNKYNVASREERYSPLIERLFASKLERRRAEYLWGLQKVGAISRLVFQSRFRLSDEVSYVADFDYWLHGDAGPVRTLEDTKGAMTPLARAKLSWMKSVGRPVTIVKDGDW